MGSKPTNRRRLLRYSIRSKLIYIVEQGTSYHEETLGSICICWIVDMCYWVSCLYVLYATWYSSQIDDG